MFAVVAYEDLMTDQPPLIDEGFINYDDAVSFLNKEVEAAGLTLEFVRKAGMEIEFEVYGTSGKLVSTGYIFSDEEEDDEL